ncbi:MAG: transcription elongation factor GreA [Planctomycetes bacterium]|nr:transcription elongation factor GreA [Planctomycetota bacterium]
MPDARWDELERAIRAKDSEAAERLWLELLERDPGHVDGFLRAADGIMERAGGRRQAGVLLWMVAGALKDKGRERDLVRLYVRLAKIAPDDGTLRQALVDATRTAYASRADVEALLERSGVVGGAAADLAKQAEALERYLRLEPGAYVFHKTGWGIGRIAEYLPERGRCVIDFISKRGHEMDLLAAADLLERLPEDDLRVMAAYRKDELRRLAAAAPLEMLAKAVRRLGGDAPLRHIKDVLVPDAVDKNAWAGWWKEAKKLATLDPAWTVGPGADPRVTHTEGGTADFNTLLLRQLSFAKDAPARRATLREFAKTAGTDPTARGVLALQAKAGLAEAPAWDGAGRVAWALLVAELDGEDPVAVLAPTFEASQDPRGLVTGLTEDAARAVAARACWKGRPADGPATLLSIAFTDDAAVADAYAELAIAAKDQAALDRLLDPIFADPPARPFLYEWAVRGLMRGRWPGRKADPARVAEQVLRTADAIAYQVKRSGEARKQKAVDALSNLLSEKNCKLVQDACAAIDVEGARHLLRLLDRNLGLKPRPKEKLEDVVLRAHPTSLTASTRASDAPTEAPPSEIYMTQAGIDKLRREHEKIVNEDMPANAAEIQRAREFGDLSENAEYHAAREKQSMLAARASNLKTMIALARAIRPEIVRTDAVSVGTKVRLRDHAGHEVVYTLLGPADVDVTRGVINYQTPLGQSLMGKKPGESVSLEVLGEKHAYDVLEIASGL